jgi:TRAP transporter TAXI family solute receptor
MFIWLLIIGLSVAALVATYMLFVEAPPPRKIIIASGGRSGAYYKFANQYAEELKKEGLELEVRETAGSRENLNLLADDNSGVSIAIVQSGVAKREELEHFQALCSLYREPLWVFYRGAKALEHLNQLQGKVSVGPAQSGTYPIATKLLQENGLAAPKVQLVEPAKIADAAAQLGKGELDAAFFVVAFDTPYVQDLLQSSDVRLLNFSRHEAYHRKFRFLSEVNVPAGLVNLGKDIPTQDVNLLAPTAMLVVRKGIHPALVPLFLTAATRVHADGDQLNNPGEFPSESFTDFPVSAEAKHFFKSGPPVLQRLLPFWMASLVDRLKVMLIPLVMLLLPLFRAAPPLVRWRTRRKIYLWYSVLRDIDQKLAAGMSAADIDKEIARLRDIEQQVSAVEVPLSYMDEMYHLRLHLRMMQDTLKSFQGQPVKKGP